MNPYVLLYIAALVGANLSVAAFGPAVTPLNAFLLIGLDLTLRDRLHDAWKGSLWRMGLLIGAAAGLSYLLNPASGQIALASFVAFAAAGVADWLAYSALRRLPWLARANGSNVVGAGVDSIIFPTLAFGSLMPGIIALQFAAKVGGGFVWSLVTRPKGTA